MSADFIDVDCVLLTHRDPLNVAPETLERAREACRAASSFTSPPPHLSLDAWRVATVLLYPRCSPGEAASYFRQWPLTLLQRIEAAFDQACQDWLRDDPLQQKDQGRETVLDGSNTDALLEAAVDFTVDYLARLFETAINSRVYVGLIPVAVLLGPDLQELRMDRSERAPVDGMYDLVAVWPDSVTSAPLPSCWDLDLEDLAAALQRPGSVSP